MSDRSVARSPRLTAHLRNAIAATREQAELAYRFAPSSYTYAVFIAARGAEALARKNKRVRASREPVPCCATDDVNYRPPLSATERHIASEGKISGGRTARQRRKQKSRVQVCPFLPAVHETGQPPDG
jgi:hypothetical protein